MTLWEKMPATFPPDATPVWVRLALPWATPFLAKYDSVLFTFLPDAFAAPNIPWYFLNGWRPQ